MADQLTERIDQPAARVPRLLTIEQVQERLVVGRSTVFQLIASRELRSVKVGRRRVVSEAAVTEYIERIDAEAAEQ